MRDSTGRPVGIAGPGCAKPGSATGTLNGAADSDIFRTRQTERSLHPGALDEEGAFGQFDQAPVASRRLRQRPVPVERSSPKLPRRPSRRKSRGFGRSQQRSPPRFDDACQARCLPRSHTATLNPLRMNPTGLSASTSMPLAGAMGHVEVCSHDPRIVDATIDDEIDNMLAATRALKPEVRAATSAIPLSSTVSRVSNLLRNNGLIKKVSNALAGRMHFKSQTKDEPGYDGRNLPGLGGYRNPSLEPLGLPEQTEYIPETELRRNERLNVSRGKIHKVLGDTDQLARHPGRAMSFPGHTTGEDPFSGPVRAARPLTVFETRLRSNSAEASLIRPLDQNPFESEKILRSSVNSLLPSSPVASSTPRRKRYHTGIADASTAMQPEVSASDTYASRAPGEASDCETLLGDRTSKLQTSPSANTFGEHGSSRGCHLKLDPRYSYVPVVDCADRKKHPSPTRADLELLMEDFRLQFPEIPLWPAAEDDEDEMDELPLSAVIAADCGG